MARSKVDNRLLREAIADAKAVRETALANAKMALEESFAPHLTSMLSNRLREMDDEFANDDDLDLDELNDPIPAADGHGAGVDGGETDAEAIEKSSFTEAAVEIGDGVQSDSKLDSSDIDSPETQKYGSSTVKEPAARTRTSSDIQNDERLGMNEADEFGDEEFNDDEEFMPEAEFGAEEFGGEEEDEFAGGDDEFVGEEDELDLDMGADGEEFDDSPPEDLDLESIIRELEADLEGGEEDFGGEMEPDLEEEGEFDVSDEDDFDIEEALSLQTHSGAADGHGTDEGGEEDKEAITKSTFTEADDFEFGGDDEEEIDLEEILREIEAEEDESEKDVEISDLQSELKEYRMAVKFLRSKLNEVNLLNAKLLFTNKLFKNFNLDVRQKMRVVENFDRAASLRESKLVYTTLAEVFSGKPASKRGKRTITESIASRPQKSTRPTKKQKGQNYTYKPTVLAEGKELSARFQKLAGITKR